MSDLNFKADELEKQYRIEHEGLAKYTVEGLILVALIFITMTGGLYWAQFSGELDFKFSSKVDDWAMFGDYIGGILNPLLTILLLYMVIKTYQSQKLELKMARLEMQRAREEAALANKHSENRNEQFQIDARKRELVSTSKLIHDELKDFYCNRNLILKQNAKPTTLEKLHLERVSDLDTIGDYMPLEMLDLYQLEQFQMLINQLGKCFKEYKELGSDEANPLINTALSYWKDVVEYLHSNDTKFSEYISYLYNLRNPVATP